MFRSLICFVALVIALGFVAPVGAHASVPAASPLAWATTNDMPQLPQPLDCDTSELKTNGAELS